MNTAISFVTTSTWQAYSGETTMSYSSQMLGLTVQNFLAGASGLAVGVAFIRGFARHRTNKLGNFWVDMVRSVLWILVPLSLLLGSGMNRARFPQIRLKIRHLCPKCLQQSIDFQSAQPQPSSGFNL